MKANNSKRMTKSLVSTAPQPTVDAVEKSFQIVAYYTLKQNKKELSIENVENEAQRLERCVEFYYVKESHDMQYLEFAADFLLKNFKELIFGVQYALEYLTDTPENDDTNKKDFTFYSLAY